MGRRGSTLLEIPRSAPGMYPGCTKGDYGGRMELEAGGLEADYTAIYSTFCQVSAAFVCICVFCDCRVELSEGSRCTRKHS